jgi:beta-phosphoglucomutase-like phosphatase (HAD superfamily)
MQLSYAAVCFDLFGTLVFDDGSACAGAAKALTLLPPRRWAVVTSCPRLVACRLLECAGLPLPRTLVSSNDVARSKPAPDPYRLAAQQLGYPPERILVVEDSSDGIAAGNAAGMDVLAILRGRSSAFARFAAYQTQWFADVVWSSSEAGIEARIDW